MSSAKRKRSSAGTASDASREDVARLTARTVPRVMGTLAAGYREHGEGLHPAQFKLLMAVNHGPVSPSDLAKHGQVSAPTISKAVAALERRGLVERTVDENDRRRVLLVLTKEGHAVMHHAHDAGIEELSHVLSAATSEELERVEAGMQSLSDVFERTHAECKDGCGHPFTAKGAR